MKPQAKLAKTLAALLCVVLTCFMTLEVAHFHTGTANDSTHCQICSAAHIAMDSHSAWIADRVLHAIERISIGEPVQGSRAVVFTAFIRPPPASFLIPE